MSKLSHFVFITLIGLSACQTQNTLPTPSIVSSAATSPKAEITQTTHFNVQLPKRFRTQQTAQVAFAKLEVKNGQQTILANGADNNGFVQAQGNTLTLSANVPDGNNWVATVGFYTNAETAPFLEIKTLFHVPVTGGSVNLNLQTHLTGAVAEALRTNNSALLNTALDINAFQSFINGLTGAQVNGQTLSFTRLNNLTPPTPISLDARQIALQIEAQNLTTFTEAAGTNLSPDSFLPAPQKLGSFTGLIGGDLIGIDQQIAMNPFNNNLFFNTTKDQPQTGGQGVVAEEFAGISWNASTKNFTNVFAKKTLGNIDTAA